MTYFKGLYLIVISTVNSFQVVTELSSRTCVLKKKFPVNRMLFGGKSVFNSSIPLPSVLCMLWKPCHFWGQTKACCNFVERVSKPALVLLNSMGILSLNVVAALLDSFCYNLFFREFMSRSIDCLLLLVSYTWADCLPPLEGGVLCCRRFQFKQIDIIAQKQFFPWLLMKLSEVRFGLVCFDTEVWQCFSRNCVNAGSGVYFD